VKCNQPYGRLAKTLLSKQVDPDPELTTYDDSAWTMSLMTQTTIQPTKDATVLQAAAEPVTEYTPAGKVSSQPQAIAYAVPDHGSPNMITLRYQLKNIKVQIAEDAFKEGPSQSLRDLSLCRPPRFGNCRPHLVSSGWTL
jgi:hypothetical protein